MLPTRNERRASSAPSPTRWHVYVVRRADGALYTGIATDVERRLAEHADDARGAKALRGRGPLELVTTREIGERGLALRVEARIKRLSKARKEELVEAGRLVEEILRELEEELA